MFSWREKPNVMRNSNTNSSHFQLTNSIGVQVWISFVLKLNSLRSLSLEINGKLHSVGARNPIGCQGGHCPGNQRKVRKNEKWLKWSGKSQGI